MQRNHIIKRLALFSAKEKLSPENWVKRGLNQSSDIVVSKMISVIETILSPIIKSAKADAERYCPGLRR